VALLAFVTSVIAWDHTAYGIEEHKSLCLFCLLLISALVNTVCCLGFEVGTFVVLGLRAASQQNPRPEAQYPDGGGPA
jgi:hypothetical protein